MHESPISLESLRRSRGTFADAVGLPPSVYSDPDFYRFELEAVFGSAWLCVGRTEQIPNVGDYLAVTRAGEPLIVVRVADSKIRAMSAVCRHRGMCLTSDTNHSEDDMLDPPRFVSGTAKNFRCPYHYWVYDLEGQLIGAPEMTRTTGFDTKSVRLPSLAVELWQGFIFVNLDSSADPAPLAPKLRKNSNKP